MKVRDQLVERSVMVLLLGSSLGLVAAFAGVLPFVTPASFTVLYLAMLVLIRRGRAGLAAWIVLVAGVGPMALAVLTHGPEHRLMAYLPLAAIAAWSWLGRRVGLLAIGILVGAVALGGLAPWSSPPEDPKLASHLIAVLVTVGFSASVIRDLRRAAERSSERAVEAQNAAAEAADAVLARHRFLSAASRELANPLHTITNNVAQLRQGADPDRAADLDRIDRAGRQLLSLIEDVLDMARTESEDWTLVTERVSLEPILVEVAVTLDAAVTANRNTLRWATTDAVVVGDPRRIRQIVLNLVSNAAKYTVDGRIEIEVVARGTEVALTVRDTGVGLAPEKLDQLFQPFVQLHDGPARRPGIGLGLALSQRLAIRMGGRVEAASLPRSGAGSEGGSIFTLHLPSATRPD